MRSNRVLLLVAAFAAALPSAADVKLPRLISDHMVLQRDRPARIWGTAAPGEAVHVRFRGHEAKAETSSDGRWEVWLPASAAGGPFDLTVAGRNTLTVADVLVGDVWVGSGQSNMGRVMTLVTDAEQEIARADDPRIRLFTVPRLVSET
jgi:sialate O-acetylesterase